MILLVSSVPIPALMIMLAIVFPRGIALSGRRSRYLSVIAAAHCRTNCAANSTAYHRTLLPAYLISHCRARTATDCTAQYRAQIAIVSCTTHQQ